MQISNKRQGILRQCRTLWLKRLVNIVQDVGMLPIAVNAMSDGVGLFFDNICKEAQGIPLEEESFMTKSRILLVNEDDLEVGIRLDNLGNRIQETSGRFLVEVRRRFMTLFNNMDVTARLNPVDTEGVAKGLKMMLNELGNSSIDEKMLIIDRVEKRLTNGISNIYREIDTLLQNAGIPAANVVLTNVASATVKKKTKQSPWMSDRTNVFGNDTLQEKVDEAAAMSLIDGGFILPDSDEAAISSFGSFGGGFRDNFAHNAAKSAAAPIVSASAPAVEKFSFAAATGNLQNAPKTGSDRPSASQNFAANLASVDTTPPPAPDFQKNQTSTVEKDEDKKEEEGEQIAPMMAPMEDPVISATQSDIAGQSPIMQQIAQFAVADAAGKLDQTMVEFAASATRRQVPITGNPLADLWNSLRREGVYSPDPTVLNIVRDRIMKRMNYLHEGMEFDDEAATISQVQMESDVYDLHQLFPDLFVNAPENNNEPDMPTGLDSRALGLPAGSPEAASLDTMDLIISTLTRNPSVPEPFKSFLLLLHPQLALFALSDSAIFTNPEHPIHLCTKTLGALILGLPPETPANHPVFEGLFESIRKPLKKLQKPVSDKVLDTVVSKIQEVLLSRMIMREEELSVVTNDYLPLLRLLEKRENVLNNIGESITKHLLPNIPAVLRDFFEGPWQQRMQKMWLEKDSDKAAWHEEFRLINNLQKTFEPANTVEEREAATRAIPPVLQEMRQVMVECNLNEVQQKVILSACVMLQNAALKGRDGLSDYKTQGSLPDMRLRAELRMRRVHSGDKRLNTLYYTGKNNLKVPLPSNFVPGVWLEFHVDRDTPCLARLCDVSELKFWYFLANPDTKQFWALQPDVLEHQFAEDRARIIIPPSPFEDAAQKVLRENS